MCDLSQMIRFVSRRADFRMHEWIESDGTEDATEPVAVLAGGY